MMKFTHNDWGQRDIIKIIIILTKRGVDMIYTAMPMKYHKYPSNNILKHGNFLAKVNKPSYKRLLDMTPCIFTVLQSIYVHWP